MKLFINLLLILCSSLCVMSAYAQAQQPTTGSIFVLPINIQVPANAKKLGAIKVGNNSTRVHCAYDDVIAQAKNKARVMGGNIVKITELRTPVFVGACYKIKADIFYAPVLPDYKVDSNAAQPTLQKQLSDTDHYALLYVYRLSDTVTFQPSYNLYMNDSAVCHVRNHSRTAIKLYKEGPTVFSAATERKVAIAIDVHFGNIYFLRCGTIMGSLRHIPRLEQVPYSAGLAEYDKQQRAHKDVDPHYLDKIH